MGRKANVCVGRLEYVECDFGLGDETNPLLGGKVRVARSKSGANMIFECADCTSGGIAAVGEGWKSWKSTLYLRKVFAWFGSTCSLGCGDWGIYHAGVGVC